MENVLNDFITAVIEERGLNISVEDARRIVTQEAKKQATNNCACLTEEEVYEIVLNSPTLLAQEKKKGKKASEVGANELVNMVKKNVERKGKAKDLIAQAAQTEEQLSLFDDETEDDETEDEDFEYEG